MTATATPQWRKFSATFPAPPNVEVRRVTLAEIGVERGPAPEKVTAVVDAEQRAAGEVFEDDGTAAERIIAFLQTAKVI